MVQNKNRVIKCLTKEHGKKIIAYWKEQGANVVSRLGSICESDGDTWIYYGFINDKFGNYSLSEVRKTNTEIFELPDESNPDNLVVGKWYTSSHWDKGSVAQFVEIDEYKDFVHDGNAFYTDGEKALSNSWGHSPGTYTGVEDPTKGIHATTQIKDEPNFFPANSFVVIEKAEYFSHGFLLNHCYELRKNATTKGFTVKVDSEGDSNGFNGNPDLFKLRKATEQEEQEYKRLGKPFDVTRLVDISKLTKTEEPDWNALLKEAAERYPIDTEYYGLDDLGRVENSKSVSIKEPRVINNCVDVGSYYVYVNGKWAEVVKPVEKTPLEICKEKYKVGMTIKSALDGCARILQKDEFPIEENDTRISTKYGFSWLYDKSTKKYAEILPETRSKFVDADGNEFVVGAWYKVTDALAQPSYRKCHKLPISNSMPYTEIIDRGIYEVGLITNCADLRRLKRVPDSEVEQYLPKQEVLVFGKYPIGSCVVSLSKSVMKIGCVVKILKESSGDELFYKDYTCSTNSDLWRAATPEETAEYEIRGESYNISELKKSSPFKTLKVGDELSEEVLNAWARLCENYNLGDGWTNNKVSFVGTRAIKNIMIFDGKYAFTVNGTASNVYLNAEGFEDFYLEFIHKDKKPIKLEDINKGDWIKIIDKPVDGNPAHWVNDDKMDYLYGTWQQVISVNSSDQPGRIRIKGGNFEGKWALKLSDVVEVSKKNPYFDMGSRPFRSSDSNGRKPILIPGKYDYVEPPSNQDCIAIGSDCTSGRYSFAFGPGTPQISPIDTTVKHPLLTKKKKKLLLSNVIKVKSVNLKIKNK